MKSLPARSTRGKRVAELIGEEKDFDDFFWGQELFKDEEADEEYVTESEPEDTFDADFFKAESSEDETEVVEAKEEKAKVKPAKEPEKRKKRRRMAVSMKSFTQSQMLEEAALTELFNLHALKEAGALLDTKESILQRKRRGLHPPVERYISKAKAGPLYSFNTLPTFPKPQAVPQKKGKYLDPLTNKRYSTPAEFRALRESHYKAMEVTLREAS